MHVHIYVCVLWFVSDPQSVVKLKGMEVMELPIHKSLVLNNSNKEVK